jgi:hypothetical protein
VLSKLSERERDVQAQLEREKQAREAFEAARDAATTSTGEALKAAEAVAANQADLRSAKAATTQSTVVRKAQRYRHASQQYLDALGSRTRDRQLLQFQGSIGFQYDDNVVLESNDEVIDFGQKADGRAVFTFVGRLLPVHNPRWQLGLEYDLFQSLHFDLNEFDLQSHTGRLFTHVKSKGVTWRLAGGYTFTLLDNARYLEEFSIVPSAKIQQTEALFIVPSLRYSTSNFFNQVIPPGQGDARDRDGWALRAGFDQYLTFIKQRSFVRLSYYYGRRRSDGTDWGFDSHRVGLGVRTSLPWDIALDVKGAYTRRNYLHRNSFDAVPLGVLTPADRRERRDDRLEGLVELSRTMWRAQAGHSLTLSIGYIHISNLSNIGFFDLNRNIVTLALSGRY